MHRRSKIMMLQDRIFLAVVDNKPVQWIELLSLPPWRAALIAGVLVKANVLHEDDLADIRSAAINSRGEGNLAELLGPSPRVVA